MNINDGWFDGGLNFTGLSASQPNCKIFKGIHLKIVDTIIVTSSGGVKGHTPYSYMCAS